MKTASKPVKTTSIPQSRPSSASAQTQASSWGLLKGMFTLTLVGMVIISCFAIGMIYTTTSESASRVYIPTQSGTIVAQASNSNPDTRIYEIKAHTDLFMHNMFAFDERSFHGNVETALNLIGGQGALIYQQYKNANMFENLVANNVRIELKTDSIKCNPYSSPYEIRFYGKQTFYTPLGKEQRYLYASLTAIDVPRSERNVHGLLIENYNTIFQDKIQP